MVSEAQKRATTKFESKAYDKILLRLRKDGFTNKELIQLAADIKAKSVNSYIIEAIEEKLYRDGFEKQLAIKDPEILKNSEK